MKSDYDTIVVGAGPAGSTTAALLAEKGHDVVLSLWNHFLCRFLYRNIYLLK